MHERLEHWVHAMPRRILVPATILTALVATLPAAAVDYYWQENGGGSFAESSNWNPLAPQGPGGANDTVNFDLATPTSSRYSVTGISGENDRLLVHDDSLTLSLSGSYTLLGTGSANPSFTVGVANGDTGDLILDGAEGSVLESVFFSIGHVAGSIGVVTVNNLQWDYSGLTVGLGGMGTLAIAGGSVVDGSSATIGRLSGSTGTVTVSGAGSDWTMEPFSELRVGDFGTGNLIIEDGGSVSSDFSYISEQTGSTGVVNVSGIGSIWNISGDLEVGGATSGTLTVSAGAEVVDGGSVYVGSDSGAAGTVTITGDSSNWTGINELVVGESGNGTVTIAAGGSVASTEGWIASLSSASGTVQITGANSGWVVDETLFVGGNDNLAGGSGDVNVSDNATLRVVETAKVWSNGRINVAGGAMIVGTGMPTPVPDQLFITAGGIVDLSDGGRIVVGPSGGVNPGVLRVSDGATLDFTFGSFVGTRINVVGELVGTGAIDGELRNNGVVRPTGSLLVDGDYLETPNSLLAIDLGGLVPGTEFDVVDVSGTATLQGTLEVSLSDDYFPDEGDMFEILSADAGVCGVFADELLPLTGRLVWNVIYEANSVVLHVIEVLPDIPGDFDTSGAVENADLTLLLNNWAGPVPPTPAGWTGIPITPPAVDNDELTALLNNWGAVLGRGSAGNSPTVPEPSLFTLVCLSLLQFLFYRMPARHNDAP